MTPQSQDKTANTGYAHTSCVRNTGSCSKQGCFNIPIYRGLNSSIGCLYLGLATGLEGLKDGLRAFTQGLVSSYRAGLRALRHLYSFRPNARIPGNRGYLHHLLCDRFSSHTVACNILFKRFTSPLSQLQCRRHSPRFLVGGVPRSHHRGPREMEDAISICGHPNLPLCFSASCSQSHGQCFLLNIFCLALFKAISLIATKKVFAELSSLSFLPFLICCCFMFFNYLQHNVIYRK